MRSTTSSPDDQKNHDAMVQLSKQFADIMRKYGVTSLYFQLKQYWLTNGGNYQHSQNYLTNPDEVWLELLFYRGSKHREEVGAKVQNDERMGTLYQQSLSLLTPGPASSWESLAESRCR